MTVEIGFGNTSLQVRKHRQITFLLAVITVGMLAYLFFFRLDQYPHLFVDESSHLHVAKNYAINGIYADYSSEGNRYTGPSVALGPTVLVPIAVLFRLFGVSFALGRVVIAVYGVLAVLTVYLIGVRLQNSRLALIATVLMLVSPGHNMIYHGRLVLGEIPGLFFVLVGLWLWFQPTKNSLPNLIGVGALMGLACITKNQYATVILPAMFLCWVAEMVWYKQQGWRYFVVPGVIAGVLYFTWLYYILFVIGSEERDVSTDLQILRGMSNYLWFQWENVRNALKFLTDGDVYAGLTIPAMIYGLLLARRRDRTGQRWGMLWIFVAVGFFLYISSIAWTRYAFMPAALASLFVAHMLYRLASDNQPDWRNLYASLRQHELSSQVIVRILLAGYALIAIGLPLFWQLKDVATLSGTDDAIRLAGFLEENIPTTETIETAEPELTILTNHSYHFPPNSVIMEGMARRLNESDATDELYDFHMMVDADYIVVGERGKVDNLYPGHHLENYDLIYSVGLYDVYHRRVE